MVKKIATRLFGKVFSLFSRSIVCVVLPHSGGSSHTYKFPILAVFLASFIPLSMIIFSSLSITEYTYTRAQSVFRKTRAINNEKRIVALSTGINNFLGYTNYRSDVQRLLVDAGYLQKGQPVLSIGGVDEPLSSNEMLNGNVAILEGIREELSVSREYLAKLEMKLSAKRPFLDSVPNIWPLAYRMGRIVRSQQKIGYDKDAILIDAPVSSPVRATAHGKIVSAYFSEEVNGFVIDIEHEFGFNTQYGALGKIEVRKGDMVEKGRIIGYTSGGGFERKYLSYKINIASTPVNPEEYISSKY